MGAAQYSIYLDDAFGTRLADASNFLSLEYSRVVNGVSTLKLTLPGTFNTTYLIIPDGRIEVWRKLESGREYLDTDTIWLIKKITRQITSSGLQTIIVEADTPLSVLREPGRFVNYYAGSNGAAYSGIAADDACKHLARDNIGVSATGSRNISAYISVDADLGQGALITKMVAWRDCLKTMQEFADSSAQAGIYVAFDIVAISAAALVFRTFVQQRGVDHRFPSGNNPVLISPDLGNMGECALAIDYREEITYVLAGGKGEGFARLTASSQDLVRQGVSPFGLREYFQNATQYDTVSGLSAEADAVLRSGRAKTIFQGKLIDTPDSRYGVDWSWGDYVTAQAFGQTIDCRIDAISVSVKPGAGYERIDAWLRSNS